MYFPGNLKNCWEGFSEKIPEEKFPRQENLQKFENIGFPDIFSIFENSHFSNPVGGNLENSHF